MSLWDYIAKPFGWLLMTLYNLVGNYGVAIFLFALVVKLILLPFQMKSKKSMMRMSALQPQVQELQKRHEGNPRKLQEETSKLYKEEHVNPMSGCLWSLIPFPILLALYRAIRFPLTTMMGVSQDLIAEGGALATKLAEMGFSSSANSAYIQLQQSQFISNHWNEFDFTTISDKLQFINYKFLGFNLGDMPKLKFWENGITWAAIGLFLIPIVSAALSYLQMAISQKAQPKTGTTQQQEKSAQSMKTMNLMMPLVSLYICFIMPAALGIYWIYTSLLGIIQEVILNKVYGKQMEAEKAEREARQRAREAEYERKRQETERLRAEGKTQENSNTSKKKQQARQRAEMDELRAAAVREERAAKRAAMGIEEEKIPDSQVGNRRYARGRAYVADRFTNPDRAAEATAAAAEESDAWTAEHAADDTTETVETVEAAAEEVSAAAPAEPETPEDEPVEDESAEDDFDDAAAEDKAYDDETEEEQE